LFIYMYHGLFAYTMYDSHGFELCTMYDSHVIYLRVLCTIYMYKFSRCHAVIFHGFFVQFTIFQQKSPDF
jgi:hypothetical protein